DRARGTFGAVRVAEPVYRTDDKTVGLHGGPGAWEVVTRVGYLDLSDPNLPHASDGLPTGGDVLTAVVGWNWYLTDFMRLMVDYTHFRTRSPIGRWSDGDLFGARFAVFW